MSWWKRMNFGENISFSWDSWVYSHPCTSANQQSICFFDAIGCRQDRSTGSWRRAHCHARPAALGESLGKSLQEKTAANIKIIKKYPCLQAFGDTPTFRFPLEIDHRAFGLSSNFRYKYPCQSYSILPVSRTWMVEHEVRYSYTRNGPAFAVLPLHRSPCGGCRLQSFAANSFGKGGLIQWWSATCTEQLLIFVSYWKHPLSSMAPESCTLAFLLGACQTSAHHIIQLEIPNNLFWSQKLCRPLLSNAILIYSISILHILIPGLQLLWTEARTFNLGAPQWQHCLECQRNAGTFTSKMAGC